MSSSRLLENLKPSLEVNASCMKRLKTIMSVKEAKKQQVYFYGDKALVNMFKFNKDISFIALNVFEIFSALEYTKKGN